MRSIGWYALLLTLGALAVPAVRAATPESCANVCADKRDQCKLKACTKAGGHSQLHQGTCYNLPMNNKQTYAAAITQCTARLQACSNNCR
jgi:hypothetical protein